MIFGLLLVSVGLWNTVISDYLKGSQETNAAAAILDSDFSDFPEVDLGSEPLVAGVPIVGDYFAVIRIPSFGENWLKTVREGTTPEVLDNLGIGHYEGTQFPGEVGNFAIAGHSGNRWSPFANYSLLKNGDQVVVETINTKYVYEIRSSETVDETDVQTVYEEPDFSEKNSGQKWLTITTCLTDGPSNKRFVLYAELVSQQNR